MSTHNPENLTEWGQSEGYRLLDQDEIISSGTQYTEGIESIECSGKWVRGFFGASKDVTYRTKLTRSELRAKRGLPNPASDTAREAAVFFAEAIDQMQVKLGFGRATPVQRHQLVTIYKDRVQQAIDDSTAALRREVEELRAERDKAIETADDQHSRLIGALQQVAELTRERDAWKHNEDIARSNCRELTEMLRTAIGERDEARGCKPDVYEHIISSERAAHEAKRAAYRERDAAQKDLSAALARAEAGVEVLAEMIYDIDRACDPEGSKHPWQKGGNSLKQDEARRKARAAIDAATGGTK